MVTREKTPSLLGATQSSRTVGFSERLLLSYARHFPLRRGKMRIVESLWPSVVKGDPYRMADLLYGGMTMPCDLRESLQRQYYFFGTYFLEEDILEIWSTMARDAKVVFDVGANAGIYSFAALAAAPDALVHAFEPTPEIAVRLRENARINQLARLMVHDVAVFDRDGQAYLRRCRGDDGTNEGMNFISVGAQERELERVGTVRLDNFCAQHGIDRIDLLKIDIQGNEPAALEGAGRLITENKIGTIFMELNWGEGDESPAALSLGRLDRASYKFSAPTLPLKWKPRGSWLRDCSDIIARSASGLDFA